MLTHTLVLFCIWCADTLVKLKERQNYRLAGDLGTLLRYTHMLITNFFFVRVAKRQDD